MKIQLSKTNYSEAQYVAHTSQLWRIKILTEPNIDINKVEQIIYSGWNPFSPTKQE